MAKGVEHDLPFQDGLPLSEEELRKRWGGLKDAPERVDGPAPPGSANRSSGGARRIKSDPEKRADIRILTAFIENQELWELVDEIEEYHADPGRPGPPRGYNFMDILVVEAAVFLHVSRYHAHRNLSDEWYWEPLYKAAEARFPQQKYPNWEARRLSPTAPSRDQAYRARKQYLVGDALEGFRRSVRQVIFKVARECGLLDPDAGTCTRPARSQTVVADKTNMHAATRFHRDDPPAPDTDAADQQPAKCGQTIKSTGKPCRLIASHRGRCRSVSPPRRCDHNADYYRLRNNTLSSVPGRGLIAASVRGDDPNVRLILDAEFTKHKDDPERVPESTQVVAMLRRLIDENTNTDDDDDPTAGILAFGYDMALSSAAIDDVLNLHRVPVVKVPRLKGNRYRGQSLGPHTFTTTDGNKEEISIQTLHGAPWVWLPSGDKLQAVPLVRRKLQWGTRGKTRTILYMHVTIPNDEDVPEPLRGAKTLIRVNSTDAEIATKPHTRRTLSLRPIWESDPHYKEIGGAREDIESTFSNVKYLTRGKLKSTDEDQNLFTLTAYMLLWMSRARTAYHKSVAANPAQAIPIAA